MSGILHSSPAVQDMIRCRRCNSSRALLLLYADLIHAEQKTRFPSNLDGVCKAGDSVPALFKGPEVRS